MYPPGQVIIELFYRRSEFLRKNINYLFIIAKTSIIVIIIIPSTDEKQYGSSIQLGILYRRDCYVKIEYHFLKLKILMKLIVRPKLANVTVDRYMTYIGAVSNKNIHFSDICDLSGYPSGIIFPYAERIFLTNCDKNFSYFNIRPCNFPALKEMWIGTRCDIQILQRFKIYTSWKSCTNMFSSCI